MSPINLPLDREAKRRLAVIRHVEEVTGNVAMSCRCFGISRQAYYIWYRRSPSRGRRGPADPLQAAQAQPGRHPRRGRRENHLPAAELPLRTEKIAMYLKRYHDITISKSGV